MNDRPTGVTIAAILAAIAGALHVFSGAAMTGIFIASFFGSNNKAMAGLGTAFGVFTLVLGVAMLITAAGLWAMSKRFWRWAIVLIGLSLARLALEAVISTVNQPAVGGDQSNLLGVALLAIVDVILLFYLMRGEVRSQFEED